MRGRNFYGFFVPSKLRTTCHSRIECFFILVCRTVRLHVQWLPIVFSSIMPRFRFRALFIFLCGNIDDLLWQYICLSNRDILVLLSACPEAMNLNINHSIQGCHFRGICDTLRCKVARYGGKVAIWCKTVHVAYILNETFLWFAHTLSNKTATTLKHELRSVVPTRCPHERHLRFPQDTDKNRSHCLRFPAVIHSMKTDIQGHEDSSQRSSCHQTTGISVPKI